MTREVISVVILSFTWHARFSPISATDFEKKDQIRGLGHARYRTLRNYVDIHKNNAVLNVKYVHFFLEKYRFVIPK